MTRRSIPDVGYDLDSHTRALQAIKEAVETGQRANQEILDSYITVREAVEFGLIGMDRSGPVTKIQDHRVLTLEGAWAPFGSVYELPGFYKDSTGRVHLKGLVKDGTGTIATLPPGFRPKLRHMFCAMSGIGVTDIGRAVEVQPTGGIVYGGAAPLYLSLDGISFAAYQ